MTKPNSSTPKKPQRRWTPQQKAKLVLKARTKQAEGTSFAQVCRDLDLCEPTLRRWMANYPPQQSAFQEVAIEVPPPEPKTISLVLPNGLRFEGLDISAAASLAKRFR